MGTSPNFDVRIKRKNQLKPLMKHWAEYERV